MAAQGTFETSVTRWQSIVLVFACLFAFLPGLASVPPTDRDESRFIQATKQMLETGDYIDIRFQDEPRYKKPIGIYWLQSAAVGLTGQGAEADVSAYRLASVAAGIVAVLALASLGTYMFGPLVGVSAGFFLVGLLGLGIEARLAKTDATLLTATLLAQAALARFYLEPRAGNVVAGRWWWCFWLAVGAGILVKGPITPLICALTIIGILILDKDRTWLRAIKPVSGLFLLGLIVLPWFIAITIKSGGAFWVESVGNDMLGKVAAGQESHGAPPGYYVLTYSLYMWPFGLLAVLGGLKALNRFREPKLLFCLCWYIPFWIVLEFIPTKLPHYPLPAFPALILLGAWALFTADGRETPLKRWQKWIGWLTLFGLGVVTVILAIGASIGPIWLTGEVLWQGILVGLLALTAGYFASGLGRPGMSLGRVIGASAASAGFGIMLTSQVVPNLAPLLISSQIEQTFSAGKRCPDSALAAVEFHEPSLVFLVGTNTVLTDVQGAADHLTSHSECGVVALPAERLSNLEKRLGTSVALEQLGQIDGINYSKGQALQLVLVQIDR